MGAYAAVVGALVMSLIPLLFTRKAKTPSVLLLTLPLALIGGTVSQFRFGHEHWLLRLLLGLLAGGFAGFIIWMIGVLLWTRARFKAASA
jgi:ABC-type cobalamin transport system permease subunit